MSGSKQQPRRKTVFEKIWQRTTPKTRYMVTIALALFFSVSDVFWAAFHNKKSEAGRGGGFAALVGLFIVLVLPDFGKRKYNHEIETIKAQKGLPEYVAQKLDALAIWVEIDNADRSKQTKALFIATAIGTLFWDLGDLFAGYLIQWFPHVFPSH